jgi:TrmH family RNA methyltransferase
MIRSRGEWVKGGSEKSLPILPDLRITSKENPRIKHLLHLRNRRERERGGEIVVEGYREILRALESAFPLEVVFYSPEHFLGENEPLLLEKARQSGATLIEISPSLMERVSYRDRPDGLIALGVWRHRLLRDVSGSLPPSPLLIVCERIEKPGNLGAIMRSADGAGVDLFILCERVTDLNNPNVVRASVGTLFSLPILEADRAEEVHAFLKRHGVPIYAATPYGETIYSDVDYTRGGAIVVGSEQYGLREFWLENATARIRIPLRGKADSLNVATATAILLFEANRQRLSRDREGRG